jgi:hypothetical protein
MNDRFRREVYQSFEQRADAGMDLVDALTSAPTVESPVGLSESALFRRGFSSVYDFLKSGRMLLPRLRRVLFRNQPEEAETIAGYEIYAVDCTGDPASEAKTLPDRGQSKKGRNAPLEVGHSYSWLVRLVERGTSWCMPLDIGRVPTESSDSQVGAEQVAALAEHNSRPKVVVADSLYCNATFLAIFLTVQFVYALVRIRSNRVLYEEPPERQPGQRGRSRKHGPKFTLSTPSRTPDRAETCTLLGQQVRLLAWTNLHFYQLPFLVGMVLSVQFLKADGTPRFKRPLYLFWTGPTSVALADLARMYLWRFAIEHMFRFLKQHLGLTASNSPNLQARLRWVWCCALAYCQLLFIRHQVADRRPPWHPTYVRGRRRPLTPRQVQRNALPFLLELGSPALPPQPAGKGRGRPPGYRPQPRKRYPVVQKSKKRLQTA